MRELKRKLSTALARHVVNPMMRAALDRGIAPRGYALLETTGRKTGLPRRTPVGNGTDGDTFWIVAEHGRSAAYVRNIEADPRVRIKVGRSWRSGTASLLPDDDPRKRQRILGRRFNAAVVRLMGTDLLTVRIDLDETTIELQGPGSRRTGRERRGVRGCLQSDVATTAASAATRAAVHRRSSPAIGRWRLPKGPKS